jgi:hypothetical protein
MNTPKNCSHFKGNTNMEIQTVANTITYNSTNIFMIDKEF